MRETKDGFDRGEQSAPGTAPKARDTSRRARPVELRAPGRIALIDASPEARRPTAGAVLDDFADALAAYARSSSSAVPDMVRIAADSGDRPSAFDAVVIACSLAPDAPLALQSTACERALLRCALEPHVRAYAVAISDAYEPEPACDALLAFEGICDASGIIWCGGVAIGAGSLIARTRKSPRMGTLRRARSQAIDRLIAAVRLGTNVDQALELAGGAGNPASPDILTVPCPLPRFLYRHIAKA